MSEHSRWDHAKDTAEKFRTDLLGASGGVENTESAVQAICEADKKAYACNLHNYMVENVPAEPIDIIEEKVRRNVIPVIVANEPAPEPSLTATEKTGALKALSYVESSMGYLQRQTTRVPDITQKVTLTSTSLAEVRLAVEADPPTSRSSARHRRTHRNVRPTQPLVRTRVTTSRRGLTPRQRRRG